MKHHLPKPCFKTKHKAASANWKASKMKPVRALVHSVLLLQRTADGYFVPQRTADEYFVLDRNLFLTPLEGGA